MVAAAASPSYLANKHKTGHIDVCHTHFPSLSYRLPLAEHKVCNLIEFKRQMVPVCCIVGTSETFFANAYSHHSYERN